MGWSSYTATTLVWLLIALRFVNPADPDRRPQGRR